ncbi:MAG: hypothetical protein M9882_01325 [Homoserinimonas sp.]|nr:hypothetical protein [Homoserinimonas sp.]MCW5944667.1 hypothetical protein [Cryobacterium sp.]
MSSRGSDRASVREKFRYWFDNVMAKGTVAVMGLLGLATVVFISIVALLVMIFQFFPPQETGEDKPTFFEVLWGNLMRTLDPGTMGGDQGWGFRAAMLVVTIGGLIMVASLIGIISSAFDSKVEELRKGKSRVIERDHTLILGWSDKVLTIVSELCVANESRKRAVIVVLADRDKVEMEDELRNVLPRKTSTRVIVRSGDPMDLNTLEIGNPYSARSIILIAPEDAEDPDSTVIKMALALTNNPKRGTEPLNVVGELQHEKNLEAAKLVGRDEVSWILARDLISKITVQTCRQSGLSGVYTELLDFDGDEIYIAPAPELAGSTFAKVQLDFAKSCVIGVVRNGEIELNPNPDSVIQPEDSLIHICADDSAIHRTEPGKPDPRQFATVSKKTYSKGRTLILGSNSDLPIIVRELDDYVERGSELVVVSEVEAQELPETSKLKVTSKKADVTSRQVLVDLKVDSFDHIIVLAAKERLDSQRADARTLVTLLHLRELGELAGKELSIVSEMLDNRNREIAEVTKADDFIVSDKLISLALSQLSENRLLSKVFDSLFKSEGSEIYLRPAEGYIKLGEPVDFYTIAGSASRMNETAIGYRLASQIHDSSNAYGVRLNPLKSEQVTLGPGDKVIVLAED